MQKQGNSGSLRRNPTDSLSNQLSFLLLSGYICVAVPPARLDELEIPLMIENNTEKHRTAYTHTVDFLEGKMPV